MKLLPWLTLCLSASVLCGQSNQQANFSELSSRDSKRLDQQRTLIATAVKRKYGTRSLTRSKSDLPFLQRLLDDHAFSKSQTYELQSLGVAFGDVLTDEFPLRWVMITDEYGTDPTLRFKSTSININPLTMISKRVEANKRIRLSELVQNTRDALSEAEKHGQ